MSTGTNVHILTLRVRTRSEDHIVTRLRAESLLGATVLHPSNLAPAAIAIVRKMSDPMPGKMQLHSSGSAPAEAWQTAVKRLLEEIISSAARPGQAAVPAGATAVIFSDRAELLASLASDWIDGCAVERWWWRSLMKGADCRGMVLNAWFEAPEYVPAALEHLADKGTLITFVRNLGSSDSRILLRSVTDSFAMPDLAAQVAVIPDFVIAPGAEKESTITVQFTDRATKAFLLPDGLPHNAPWQRWVPESSGAGLNQLQQCLLGIGLMLARAPHVVRSLSFATAVRYWSRQGPDTDRNAVHVQAATEEVSPQPEAHASEPAKAGQRSPASAAADPDAPTNPRQLATRANKVLPLTPVDSARTGAVDRHLPKPRHGRLTGKLEESTADMIMQPSLSEPATAHEAVPADSAAILETSINTQLGGLFYMINLGIYLNLYVDFTSPLQPGIVLPIWDFVALIGRRLLGDNIEADPLWLLLSRLSGHCDSAAPGKDFEPPDRWHLPAEWLSPFPEPGRWKWSAKDGRLNVRHAEGFLVLDLPLDGDDPLERARRETEMYRQVVPFELERVAVGGCRKAASPLDRWLDRLMPYLQARLKRAIGFSEAGELPHVLCRHKARVSVTAAHVDILFALDEHPIEIRLAGLDRNPGWVPAAGRFIAFHYG